MCASLYAYLEMTNAGLSSIDRRKCVCVTQDCLQLAQVRILNRICILIFKIKLKNT